MAGDIWMVTCKDGGVRHPNPFATYGDAADWAWWGHTCAAQHTFASRANQGVCIHCDEEVEWRDGAWRELTTARGNEVCPGNDRGPYRHEVEAS